MTRAVAAFVAVRPVVDNDERSAAEKPVARSQVSVSAIVLVEDRLGDVVVGDPVARGALDGVIREYDSHRRSHDRAAYARPRSGSCRHEFHHAVGAKWQRAPELCS
jgi:hypothetical protein